jgi:hypothetical protein
MSESRWMKIHATSNGDLLYESKFLTENLSVSAKAIKSEWANLSPRERYDFTQAFQAKPEITKDDEEILDFLMAVGDHTIWLTISPLLSRHSNREKTMAFLLERIADSDKPKANFYQTLESMCDTRALPVLRRCYERYGASVERGEFEEKLDYLDYLLCTRALLAIEGGREYAETLLHYSASTDEQIAGWARRLLENRQNNLNSC